MMNFRLAFIVAGAMLSGLSAPAGAQMSTMLFSAALNGGVAKSIMPDSKLGQSIIKQLQAHTGSPGEITLEAVLVKRFVQQPNCGRVAFAPYQESTKTAFGRLGGEINICLDGSPPLRVCQAAPSALVPFNATCADGKAPVDTSEVQLAIREAIARGGLTGDEIHKRMTRTYKPRSSEAGHGGVNAK